jgi:hypothetical protein
MTASLIRPCLLVAITLAAFGSAANGQERPGWTPLQKEEQEVFDGMVRASTPGEPHKLLATLAGEWTFTSRVWMNPDLPPEESPGTATLSMIMGGRYLQTRYAGQLVGVRFEGFGLTGYDNTSRQYQSVWLDNTSTVLMFLTGTYDPTAKRLTLRTEMNDLADPATMVPIREVLTLVDANTHRIEVFESRKGRESKTLEMMFARKP